MVCAVCGCSIASGWPHSENATGSKSVGLRVRFIERDDLVWILARNEQQSKDGYLPPSSDRYEIRACNLYATTISVSVNAGIAS